MTYADRLTLALAALVARQESHTGEWAGYLTDSDVLGAAEGWTTSDLTADEPDYADYDRLRDDLFAACEAAA